MDVFAILLIITVFSNLRLFRFSFCPFFNSHRLPFTFSYHEIKLFSVIMFIGKDYKYDWLNFEMLPPYINGYGGPEGLRTVITCKFKSERRPDLIGVSSSLHVGKRIRVDIAADNKGRMLKPFMLKIPLM